MIVARACAHVTLGGRGMPAMFLTVPTTAPRITGYVTLILWLVSVTKVT